MKKTILLFTLLVTSISFKVYAFETIAPYAFMYDYQSGTSLLEKEADKQVTPSSMTKLMTLYIAFEQLKKKQLKLEDTIYVSEKAWRMQGSKSFVKVGDRISVEILIKGIVIQSGNDATVALAEGIASTEAEFAKLMNKKAKELGMNNSHFINSTGWPEEGHVMSVRDLATLATHIIRDFPEYYHYFAQEEFTYNNIKQPNRNRLLFRNIGVDGLKTGHSDAGGYGITVSGVSEGRRVIVVVNGLKNDTQRANEAERILIYGYRNFSGKQIFKANDIVGKTKVKFGKSDIVHAISDKDIYITLPKFEIDKLTTQVKINDSIEAPIAKNSKIGELIVSTPSMKPISYPLYAAEDIQKGNFIQIYWQKFMDLF